MAIKVHISDMSAGATSFFLHILLLLPFFFFFFLFLILYDLFIIHLLSIYDYCLFIIYLFIIYAAGLCIGSSGAEGYKQEIVGSNRKRNLTNIRRLKLHWRTSMASKLLIITVFVFDLIAFGLAVAAEQRRSTVSLSSIFLLFLSIFHFNSSLQITAWNKNLILRLTV